MARNMELKMRNIGNYQSPLFRLSCNWHRVTEQTHLPSDQNPRKRTLGSKGGSHDSYASINFLSTGPQPDIGRTGGINTPKADFV